VHNLLRQPGQGNYSVEELLQQHSLPTLTLKDFSFTTSADGRLRYALKTSD
jgi:hypothetical protein